MNSNLPPPMSRDELMSLEKNPKGGAKLENLLLNDGITKGKP